MIELNQLKANKQNCIFEINQMFGNGKGIKTKEFRTNTTKQCKKHDKNKP
jgi:hypothetical protein